jgi:hypothetical protein
VPNTIEITTTTRGFEVSAGGHTVHVPTIEDAFAFARQRLQLAQQLRELSARCE